MNTQWGKRRFTVVNVRNTQFILVLLFNNYCIIFHMNNCKPTFAHSVLLNDWPTKWWLCGEHAGLGTGLEWSGGPAGRLWQNQTGGDGGAWVYKMPRFRDSPLAVMHKLLIEKNFWV